jgi:hypothetical protein
LSTCSVKGTSRTRKTSSLQTSGRQEDRTNAKEIVVRTITCTLPVVGAIIIAIAFHLPVGSLAFGSGKHGLAPIRPAAVDIDSVDLFDRLRKSTRSGRECFALAEVLVNLALGRKVVKNDMIWVSTGDWKMKAEGGM